MSCSWKPGFGQTCSRAKITVSVCVEPQKKKHAPRRTASRASVARIRRDHITEKEGSASEKNQAQDDERTVSSDDCSTPRQSLHAVNKNSSVISYRTINELNSSREVNQEILIVNILDRYS